VIVPLKGGEKEKPPFLGCGESGPLWMRIRPYPTPFKWLFHSNLSQTLKVMVQESATFFRFFSKELCPFTKIIN